MTTFGGSKPPVDRFQLLRLYEQQDYRGMLRMVRESLRLDMQLRIAYVNSGGPKSAPAWVHAPVPMPMYGTQEFRNTKVTVYIRKAFIEEAPFSALVCAMSHELSHVVLNSMGHSLRTQEEAVDLTAMILGYRDFFLDKVVIRRITILDTPPRSWFDKLTNEYPIPDVKIGYEKRNLGYLSEEERIFAASLMR